MSAVLDCNTFHPPSYLRKLMVRLLYLLHSINPLYTAKGTVTPDDRHLEGDRVVFRAPNAASAVMTRMLLADKAFAETLPQNNQEYLMQLAVCDGQLRVNLYCVERDNSLLPIFDHCWHNTGVFNYLLSPDRTFAQLMRPSPGRFYHPLDARVSYARDLTTSELMEIDRMRFVGR